MRPNMREGFGSVAALRFSARRRNASAALGFTRFSAIAARY
jgi:hypothetical protein